MLKIENLHVSVEGKEILKGVSLEVKKGEIHAIMGPNGSGKSTLSSVIAGNEDYEVTKGNIYFNNENIEDLSAEERAHKGIFMSFQYPVEIPGITVTNFIKTAINSNLKASRMERQCEHASGLLKTANRRLMPMGKQSGVLHSLHSRDQSVDSLFPCNIFVTTILSRKNWQILKLVFLLGFSDLRFSGGRRCRQIASSSRRYVATFTYTSCQ